MISLLDLKVGDIAYVVTSGNVIYPVTVVRVTPKGIIRTEVDKPLSQNPKSWYSNGMEIGNDSAWSSNRLHHPSDKVVIELLDKAKARKLAQKISDAVSSRNVGIDKLIEVCKILDLEV
jgi:hypothetical protein